MLAQSCWRVQRGRACGITRCTHERAWVMIIEGDVEVKLTTPSPVRRAERGAVIVAGASGVGIATHAARRCARRSCTPSG